MLPWSRSSSRSRVLRAASLAAFVTAFAVTVPSAARAADPVAPPPVPPAAGSPTAGSPTDLAPGATESVAPRLAVVEAEVRAVERWLGVLRRVRTDLRAGRDDAAPASDEVQAARELALRGVREVLRYESVRTKAVAALATATQAHDEPKVAEAKAALDAADTKLADALARIESDAAARKDAEKGAKPEPSADTSADKSSGKSSGKSADKPADKSADKSASKSASKSAAKPAGKTTEKATEKTTEKAPEKAPEKATDPSADTGKPAPRRGDPPSSMDVDPDED